MVDTNTVPALKLAIKQNEVGNSSPYCLTYARMGTSGASFGIFQGDTNVNQTARNTLRQVLQKAGVSSNDCNRIIAGVSQPCPNGNPLSAADTTSANNALAANTDLVDGMD